jgi:hypothetical protein
MLAHRAFLHLIMSPCLTPQADFTDATIVYFSSLCFPEDVLRQASRKLDTLHVLHTIVSLRMLPLRTFALQVCRALPMSWGNNGAMAYVYCRIEFFPLHWPHPLLVPASGLHTSCASLVVYGGEQMWIAPTDSAC